MRIDSYGTLLVGTTDSNVTNNAGNNPGINIGTAGIKGLMAAARYQGAPLGLNRLGNDGDIQTFSKDGSTVGSIGSKGGDALYIQSGTTSGAGLHMHPTAGNINPARNGAKVDNAIDLGRSSHRFKELYLSGDVYLNNTNKASIPSSVLSLIFNTSSSSYPNVLSGDMEEALSLIHI